MNKKTIRIVLEVGSPIFIGREPNSTSKDPTLIDLVTLDHFTISNGSVHWTVIDSKGSIYQGGLRMVSLSCGVTLTPSIPVVLNKRWNGLSPEFVFKVEKDFVVATLSSIKKKYLVKDKNLFQSIKKGGRP